MQEWKWRPARNRVWWRWSLMVMLLPLAVLGCVHEGTPLVEEPTGTAESEDLPPVKPANPPHKVFVSPADPLSPAEAQASFTLPPGFEIQLVASEPDIQKPMQLAFDERGRLLASCSRDYPLGPTNGEAPSDSVFALDVDGKTGAATKITTYASGYTICSGLEALPGGRVILAHAPDILLLSDTDQDGAADASEVLYTGFARTDTHELPNSFTWGLDGWLYGLQGHVNESNVKNKEGGEITKIHHGNVYRMRPDGSRIEIWARGMSNPWGLAFDRGQELFGADCESRPIWQIVEGLPYQGFLQEDEPLGFAPFITEDPHGASGFAGLVSYTGRAFPGAYRDCLYMGSPITGIIYRDRPEGTGSTKYLTRKPDFLTSTDPWFRPVDIELGPDGALYIADWYNRIIAHVEVPLDHPDRDKKRGRIWRIVYRGNGANAQEDTGAIATQFRGPMATDWSQVSKRELISALSDSNAWIRRQASAQLACRFGEDVASAARRLLKQSKSSELARLEAVGLLERGDALRYGELMALAGDPSPLIRRRATRALGHWDAVPAQERRTLIAGMLSDPSPVVQREAALALQRIPGEDSLRALLAWEASARFDTGQKSPGRPDTLLDYARGISIREHLKDDTTFKVLERADESTAALLMKYLVATPTPSAAELQANWLVRGSIPPAYQFRVLRNILAHAGPETVRSTFCPDPDQLPSAGPPLKTYASEVFGGTLPRDSILDVKALHAAWFPRLAASEDPDARRIALDMAAKYQSPDGLPLAWRAIQDFSADSRMRQTAAELLLNLRYDEAAGEILGAVANPDEDPSVRRSMAYALAARARDRNRFDALLTVLTGSPTTVQQGAVESLARQRPGVTYLLEAVERGALNPGYLNSVLVRIYIDTIHKDPELTTWHRRLVESVEDAESRANAQIEKYRALYDAHPNRDINRGQELVEGTCLLCHRIGGFGGLRAPNLDGIGNRGIDRLLQDILQPNKDIDPAFRSTMITTRDGRTEEGYVNEEDAEWVTLVDATGWESDIRKSDIQERKKLWVSPMPPDFGSSVPEEDFLDIVGFLLNPPERIRPLTDKWISTKP